MNQGGKNVTTISKINRQGRKTVITFSSKLELHYLLHQLQGGFIPDPYKR